MDYFSYKKSDCHEPTIEYNSPFLPTPPPTPSSNLLERKKRRFTNPLPTFHRLHILIVDDNSINLQILSRLLTVHMKQHIDHIELASSGVKALELLKHKPFDLILMDIDMPVLSGIETTHYIRSSSEFDILSKNRKSPIVAVTTNVSTSWRQKFNDVGMDGCIAKPISTLELKNTLARVLDLPFLFSPLTPP